MYNINISNVIIRIIQNIQWHHKQTHSFFFAIATGYLFHQVTLQSLGIFRISFGFGHRCLKFRQITSRHPKSWCSKITTTTSTVLRVRWLGSRRVQSSFSPRCSKKAMGGHAKIHVRTWTHGMRPPAHSTWHICRPHWRLISPTIRPSTWSLAPLKFDKAQEKWALKTLQKYFLFGIITFHRSFKGLPYVKL